MRHTANRLFWVVFSLLLLCGPTKAKGEQSELVQKLSQTEGISGIQALPAGEFKEKYQFFIEQLIDPKHPETGKFKQRVFVSHVGFDRPTLIVTEGYGAEYAKNERFREELSRLFDMNMVVVEYRYFLESIPSPLNWDYLTVENSLNDLHRIRTAFAPIYPGKWASTGTSKGGQTTLFYRVFYPDDVDISVPYVAPLNRSVEDGRHEVFLRDQVGTPEERAAAEMLRLAETERKTKVVIRLHEAPARPWRIAVATALSAAAIVAVAVTLNRPTVYGYVNGRPVTSLAEARTCTEDLFSDMHAGKADRTAPLREILDIE